jgi:RNA polymerase sigma factor (sigma-70 family)
LDALIARYRPRLERWASGRLPMYARSLLDTNDLVHEILLKTIQSLSSIRAAEPGSFQAYVRQAILNRIRDQVRWARKRVGSEAVAEDLIDVAPSPLENAIGADIVRRYEDGLAMLSEEERQLLHLRIELDFHYNEIAAMTGRSTPDAARMSVHRAFRKLALLMRDDS